MWLIFVDETSDVKFKDYFSLSAAVINSNFYRQIKRDFQDILTRGGWDPCVEFKGSYLFSASKGCADVSVEKRVDMTSEILALNVARLNARMRFAYFHKESTDQRADYQLWLPQLVDKVLIKAKKGSGKDTVGFYCDKRPDIKPAEIQSVVQPILEEKGYTLLEDVVMLDSNFQTIGILYADIVGYLGGRIQTISYDYELFDNIPPEEFETNGKIRKLRTSIDLINNIKQLSVYRVKPK